MGRRVEVFAITSKAAQQAAAAMFKAKKSYEVTVKHGEQVTHIADF